MIKWFSWVFLLSMTACAPWVPAVGPYDAPSCHFSVILPEKWMKFKTDDYLLVSKDGPFLQYVLIQERQVGEPFEHTGKTLHRGMLAQEAAQVIIDEISADRGISNFQVVENRPARINGLDGFNLVFTHKNRDGLLFRTQYYGFLSGARFYAIRYNAAQRYYFDKDIHTFESILSSFEVTEKQKG
jgi:hypothetical protein